MAIIHKGGLDASGLRIGIVVSRFNSLVTDRLLKGALRALADLGAKDDQIEVVQVPGAFEIPLFAEHLASGGKFDAILCLGAIVRGDTQHHEYLGHAIFPALQNMQITHRRPIIVGILTTENMEQALQRSGDEPSNKGYEAATTAVECVNLRHQLG
ncbi:MAG: 6,7-dimethyl-8-ribityllumazine synthase [Deltaproteobacteria bacterium]|nr:6,7-dimethyl-8-ribityllumazine synthase [Deltaproteobacteria bacterium]